MKGFDSLENPAEPTEVQACITGLLREWGMADCPEAVNRGKCYELTDTVLHQTDGQLYRLTTNDLPPEYYTENEPGIEPEPFHVWVYDGDRHYDAETPEGVGDWRELPFFQRTLAV